MPALTLILRAYTRAQQRGLYLLDECLSDSYIAATMSGWTVKRDGACSKCGRLLRAGEVAVWVRGANRMECIECPTATGNASPTPLERGVAGASAWREHDRRAATREAKYKGQFGDRVAGWVTKLTDEPRSTRSWAVGAVGEERLASILQSVPGVEVLNDRIVPGRKTNIDHIVIAPAGVFVVDAKHYKGQIQVKRRGSFFHPEERLYVGRWDCTKDVGGVKGQVAVVETALQSSTIVPKPRVVPVLCFVDGEWPLFGAVNLFEGVHLESERSIRKLLTAAADDAVVAIDRVAHELARLLPAK